MVPNLFVVNFGNSFLEGIFSQKLGNYSSHDRFPLNFHPGRRGRQERGEGKEDSGGQADGGPEAHGEVAGLYRQVAPGAAFGQIQMMLKF